MIDFFNEFIFPGLATILLGGWLIYLNRKDKQQRATKKFQNGFHKRNADIMADNMTYHQQRGFQVKDTLLKRQKNKPQLKWRLTTND